MEGFGGIAITALARVCISTILVISSSKQLLLLLRYLGGYSRSFALQSSSYTRGPVVLAPGLVLLGPPGGPQAFSQVLYSIFTCSLRLVLF